VRKYEVRKYEARKCLEGWHESQRYIEESRKRSTAVGMTI
jgi:hypothetical protein